MARFIIEGTSNGKIEHRSVHPAASEQLRAWAARTPSITFTDRSQMDLSVRDCTDGEAVEEISAYGELIAGCARHNVASAAALNAAERAA